MLPTKFRFIWPSVSKKKIFRNRPIRNKNCLWQPCLLMNRDEMSNLHSGPSKDAPYQVLIHLAKRFQRRRFFRNQRIRNKNGLWRPCLVTVSDMFVDGSGQNEQSLERTFHRCFLPSFTSFGRAVSEEKIKMWKVNSDGKSSHCLWQGELKNQWYYIY